MDPFLSVEAVRRLTGYERPSNQLTWCKKNGVRAWLSAANECIVPCTAIDGKPAAANDSGWTPNFKAIRREA